MVFIRKGSILLSFIGLHEDYLMARELGQFFASTIYLKFYVGVSINIRDTREFFSPWW